MTLPLAGRNALITGGSRGLGLAIAQAYVKAGASVFLCARDETTLHAAAQTVRDSTDQGQQVHARPADVSDSGQVETLASAVLETFPRLHILVNNAVIYGPIGELESVDWGFWIKALQINLMGSVLLCRALLPHFKQHGYGKIIQLSGGGATSPLPRFSAYAASKAAVVRFAETLAEELRDDHVDVNAIAPGALDTRMLDEALAAGPARVGEAFHQRMQQVKEDGGAPLERGASLAVFLGSEASDGITGKLISAIWDPWESLPDRQEALWESDIYTLRRIVPEDRGLEWG
jgi:NAD(P)-dependent dehydrogenase (short-subunit alcohol dehydrogenase family)